MPDRHRQRLPVFEDEPAPINLKTGDVPDRRPDRPRVAAILARHEPVAGALEDYEPAHLLGDLGHELHRAGARPDHRDPLAAQVVVVIPAGGVEAVTGVFLAAVDPRVGRLVELPRRQHHGVGLPFAPVAARQRPATGLVVPRAGADLDARHHEAIDPVLAGHVVQVGEDLLLRRAQARPVTALRKRERIQVAGHVAGRARVGVVEPRAAEVGAPLEDRHVVEAVLLQLDRGGQPPKAAADDHDAEVSGLAHLPNLS